jgi:hypothetical protein
MDPFVSAPQDISRLLFAQFSHKSLSDLQTVSKHMAARALEEAIRRYYGTRAAYDLVAVPDIKTLTKQAAYLFICRPGTGMLSLECAAMSGDIDTVLLAIHTGATTFYEACFLATRRGYYDIAVLLFGQHINPVHRPTLLRTAYYSGNRALIAFFSKYAVPLDWDNVIEGACQGGHVDIVDEIFHKYTGARERLIGLASEGRLEMVKYLVENKGITIKDDFAINKAISARRPEIAHYLLDTFPQADNIFAFEEACSSGYLDLVKRLLPDDEFRLSDGFDGACICNRIDVMGFLVGHMKVDWNVALEVVCKFGTADSIPTITYCVSMGATDFAGVLRKIQTDMCANPDDCIIELLTDYSAAK